MSKTLSLFFAVASILLLLATAFTISYNGWLALMFGMLALAVMAIGFVVKARLKRNPLKP
jgi:hypothetical protein